MPSIFFVLDETRHEIELFPELAPQTVGKLISYLPTKIDVHCAKIAGQHIFWHTPVVTDIEKAQDILTLPAGTFLYWPERQFLELIYGELQAEKAQVSVLGRLKGDIDWLRKFGQHVVEHHGHELLEAQLEAGEGCQELAVPEKPPKTSELAALRKARKEIWVAPPEEMFAMIRRSGMMLPYGPLAMAEGEFRKLHELLWRLRNENYGVSTAVRANVVCFLIDAFNARIDGFCGLHASGRVLDSAKGLLGDPEIASDVVEELILYTGRAAAWLDGFIPWHALNAETLRSLGGQGFRQ